MRHFLHPVQQEREHMKARLIAALSAGVAAVAAVPLIAGMAAGATAQLAPPPTPTNPNPAVPANPNPKVCADYTAAVKAAEDYYKEALRTYESDLSLLGKGTYASWKDVLNSRTELDEAIIALEKAEYAQATCWNNTANPKDKNCIDLNLALNLLLAELPATKDILNNAQLLLQQAERLPKKYQTPALLLPLKKAVATDAAAVASLDTAIAKARQELEKNCPEKPPAPPTPAPTKSSTPPSSPSPSPSPTSHSSSPAPTPSTTTTSTG